jgi:cobalt-zinc-cadmium efflux system protein
MGAGHAHGHVAVDRAGQSRALIVALVVNLAYTAVEAIAGVLTDSLALLADAAHNLSDVGALAIALIAAWLAGRPPTARRSFGYQRAEILSALANGVILVVISVWIFIEAAERLASPPEVAGGWVIGVAGVGIVVNGLTGALLWRAGASSLNVRAAALHLAGDALASVGVVIAGVVILATGWLQADPVVSIVVGVLIIAGTWSTLRDSVGVLLEEAPRGLDVADVGRKMASVPGVVEVHDLHVWTITSGFPALSAHVLVRPGDDCHARRRELEELLEHEFGIEHTTLQVDHVSEPGGLVQLERFGRGAQS